VSGFRLDKYLVTVGRFRQFVDAWSGGAGYTPPAGSGKHTHLNGGLGLANNENPGTYEPGWVGSDDSDIAPTITNLGSGAPYSAHFAHRDHLFRGIVTTRFASSWSERSDAQAVQGS
jgi:hypothetical protein